MSKSPKPLPLYKTQARTVKEAKRRMLRLLTLGWCVKFIASDGDGNLLSPNHSNAVNVCLLGALKRANLDPVIHDRVDESLDQLTNTVSYTIFNDRQKSVKPVLALVRRIPEGGRGKR